MQIDVDLQFTLFNSQRQKRIQWSKNDPKTFLIYFFTDFHLLHVFLKILLSLSPDF